MNDDNAAQPKQEHETHEPGDGHGDEPEDEQVDIELPSSHHLYHVRKRGTPPSMMTASTTTATIAMTSRVFVRIIHLTEKPPGAVTPRGSTKGSNMPEGVEDKRWV